MWWGIDYWFVIVCGVAVITGLVLWWWGSGYWFDILCGLAVINGCILCLVGH